MPDMKLNPQTWVQLNPPVNVTQSLSGFPAGHNSIRLAATDNVEPVKRYQRGSCSLVDLFLMSHSWAVRSLTLKRMNGWRQVKR